jgi:hypothetical protein
MISCLADNGFRGIVMTLMGVVQNYTGLLIARIFLGITEAGLFPGVAVRQIRTNQPIVRD